jgi:hypothetical protein
LGEFPEDATTPIDGTTPSDGGPVEDGTVNDGAVDDGSSQDATVDGDAAGDATLDGSEAGTNSFVAGTYSPGQSQQCGINATFALTTSPSIVANPFGSNGSVVFALQPGPTETAAATGLSISAFSSPESSGWTCTLTQVNSLLLSVTCEKAQLNPCTQTFVPL